MGALAAADCTWSARDNTYCCGKWAWLAGHGCCTKFSVGIAGGSWSLHGKQAAGCNGRCASTMCFLVWKDIQYKLPGWVSIDHWLEIVFIYGVCCMLQNWEISDGYVCQKRFCGISKLVHILQYSFAFECRATCPVWVRPNQNRPSPFPGRMS